MSEEVEKPAPRGKAKALTTFEELVEAELSRPLTFAEGKLLANLKAERKAKMKVRA